MHNKNYKYMSGLSKCLPLSHCLRLQISLSEGDASAWMSYSADQMLQLACTLIVLSINTSIWNKKEVHINVYAKSMILKLTVMLVLMSMRWTKTAGNNFMRFKLKKVIINEAHIEFQTYYMYMYKTAPILICSKYDDALSILVLWTCVKENCLLSNG